jgi:hypothetical protein
MKRKIDIFDGVVLLGFLGLIFSNQWLFSYIWDLDIWDLKYLEWYLHQGAKITWVVALIAFICGDLNRNISLISARPLEFLGGYIGLLSEIFLTMATIGVVQPKKESPISSYFGIDRMIAMIVTSVFGILVLIWLLVVVPLQYFLFFICGAPARIIMCSEERPKDSPTGWWNASVMQNPVSITAGFAGMALWLASIIVKKSVA